MNDCKTLRNGCHQKNKDFCRLKILGKWPPETHKEAATMNLHQNLHNTYNVTPPKATVFNNLKPCAQPQSETNTLDIIEQSAGITSDTPLTSSLANTQQNSPLPQSGDAIKKPDFIKIKHWQEWQNSGIDPEIIALNLISLEGDDTHEYLLEDAIANLGKDKKVPYSNQYVTAEVKKILQRYQHTLTGGWWSNGVDPLNNYAIMRWGCLKCDTPRLDYDNRKFIKYEHPPDVPTRTFFLKVSKGIWQKISDFYGVPIGDCEHFWEWVIKNNLPIILCEGVKKAAALLSLGFIAVGLPGIYGGYRKKPHNNKQHILIPELQILATKDREIIICFDNDLKPTTRKNVNTATFRTAKLFRNKQCKVKVAVWKYPEKGIDDVLMAYGEETVKYILQNALSVTDWQTKDFYQLSKTVNLTLNQRYLGDILTNIPHKVIGVKSPKGTGKTEALKPLVDQLVNNGYGVYLISHRIQLGQASSMRLGIPYIDDVKYGDRSKGFVVVIDSLHGEGKGQFDVENDEYLLSNKYVVIIDEIEQVLWHLLNSNTEVKKHRTEVLKQLQLLLLNADKIIGLDADLTDVSLDFIKEATKCNDKDFFIINNEYKQGGYKIYNYEETTPVNWLADLLAAIANGDKVLICTDSQKIKGQFSSQTIEALIIQRYPELKHKILRIDSESVADPDHIAYVCIPKINDIITQYNIVIISPSVGTGISMDVRNHFHSVWGCFQGVQSENAVRQQLMRLRDNVPRHIWISKCGLSWQGDGSTFFEGLMASEKRAFKIHLNQLKEAGMEILESEINTNAAALNCYLKMACRINHEMGHYRGIILKNLVNEGHKVINKVNEDNEKLKEEVKVLRDKKYLQEREEICATDIDDLDDDKYQELTNKKAKTKVDRRRERKFSTKKRYGVDVTPDLLLKDDEGYYSQLRLHYYLSLGFDHAPSKDKKACESVKEKQSVFIPDFNKSQRTAQVKLLRIFNILEIIQLAEIWDTHPLIVNMMQKIELDSLTIQSLFGKIPRQPMRAVKKLLKAVGLNLEFSYRQGTGDRTRVYTISGLNDGREQIFEKWYKEDTENLETVSTYYQNPATFTNISNIQSMGVDTENHPQEQQTLQDPHKTCWVWDGDAGKWVGAVVKKVETLVNGCFQALVTLWNGCDCYIWDERLIALC